MAVLLDTVELRAPAKVNLRLLVLERLASGYHALESLVCALSLADTVRVARGSGGVRLRVQGAEQTGPPERNLAVLAAERFYAELGAAPAVEIELVKRIPAAAGLGGGSSDGAATLRALNALHGEPLAPATLLRLGGELGSDLPFFLAGSAYALAWGRGERLLALPPLPPRPVLVAHPGEPMPTPAAFRRLAEQRGVGHRPPALRFALADLSAWDGVAALATNDFQAPAVARIPRLGAALERLRAAGASVALLAGSGAALFGVFAAAAARDAAAGPLAALGFRTWAAETLSALPAPTPGGRSG